MKIKVPPCLLERTLPMILMKACFFIVPKNSGSIAAQDFSAFFRASLCNASSSSAKDTNTERTHIESKTAIDVDTISPELSVAISIDPLHTVMRPGFVTFITREAGRGFGKDRSGHLAKRTRGKIQERR